MERKIGEIFEYNGEWYQCVECDSCGKCSLRTTECGSRTKSDLVDEVFGECSKIRRSDYKHIIFKKLEKVGKYCTIAGTLYQHYKVFDIDNVCGDGCWWVHNYKAKTLAIEIKQNKEDMEEKNESAEEISIHIANEFKEKLEKHFKEKMEENYKAEDTPLTRLVGRYVNNLIDYDVFEKAVKELYADKEESKPNLKPFDLEAAKSGKPVCTRDGRKARIICFDLKNGEYPIVAAVGNDSSEILFSYTTNGEIADGLESDKDLMMLPEKRSGWAKVRKDINLYDTKEEADRKMIGNDEYVTAKVEWEE